MSNIFKRTNQDSEFIFRVDYHHKCDAWISIEIGMSQIYDICSERVNNYFSKNITKSIKKQNI